MIENNVMAYCDISKLLRECKGLLFDFDGVLADSEPYFRKAWNRVLEPFGHSVSERDYWYHWASLGEGIEGEIRRHGLEGIDVGGAKAKQKRFYREFVERGDIPLFPTTAELLHTLLSPPFKTRFPFRIASNSDCDVIESILLNGGAQVPAITGGRGLKKKPAPDIFLKAADELNLSASEILVFEDSQKGIDAAYAGGFTPVLVKNRLNADIGIHCTYTVSGLDYIL
ncbi:MAG: HAD family phosphatase, partial [FCB group bacterium]|nr:HAD family phosphatase [FCB group bacterium]